MTCRRPSLMPRLMVVACLLVGAGSAAAAEFDAAEIDSLNGLSRNWIFANVEKAADLYGDVAAAASALGDTLQEARALQNQGLALYMSGGYEDGVTASLAAARLFEQLGRTHDLAQTYGDLGYHMKRRNMDRAYSLMRQGIHIAEAADDSSLLSSLYNNFGVLHEMSARPDSAEYFYRRSLAFDVALGDSAGVPYSLDNLAGLAIQRGRLDEAERFLRRAASRYADFGDVYGGLTNRLQRAEVIAQRGDAAGAVAAFEAVIADPNARPHDLLVAHCLQRLADIYEQEQDHERALAAHRRFAAYRDSLFNVETTARMAELEVEFETERKDRVLAENKLALAARARQIGLLVAGLIVLAVAAAGIVSYQQQKRRQLKRELELRAQLRRQEIDRKLAEEKLRISRELHDNIGAQLTFMTSTLDTLGHGSADGVRDGLDDLAAFGRRTLGELRDTVWAMKTEGEGVAALVRKLRDLRRQASAGGRDVEFAGPATGDEAPALSSGRLLNAYRIAQEAVQNALKHTTAGNIVVTLRRDGEDVVLVISDEGPGFERGATGHVGGLDNMRLRCEEVGGGFDLASGPQGTTVTCRFPPE